MTARTTTLIRFTFWSFIVLYTATLLINPQLGPNDDFVFLRTLQAGKPLLYDSPHFPYYDRIDLGRFQPLVAMEYNVMGLIGKTPFWYYFYHALQFAIFAFLLLKLLKTATKHNWIAYSTAILFFFLPSFTIIWFRLQLPERNVLFWGAIFLVLFLSYQKKPSFLTFLGALLMVNMALYNKEVAFLLFGGFAATHLLLSWKMIERKMKALDIAVIASSVLYLLLYYFIIFRSSHPFIAHIPHTIPLAIKNVWNYGFFSDSILILLLVPTAIIRFWHVMVKHESAEPFFDALLVGATGYVASFIILGLYGTYYLLPAYLGAIPALLYLLPRMVPRNMVLNILCVITAFLFITNVLPAGIHFLTYHKYISINFNKTLDFLAKDIQAHHPHERANIFLDGIDLGPGRGTFFIFGEFLLSKGITAEQFDLKANVIGAKPEPVISKISLPFTAMSKDSTSTIARGDYLVVVPQRNIETTNEYLHSLESDYVRVFDTPSPLAFPAYNLKTLLKYLLATSGKSDLLHSTNLLDQPNYYVFVKR